MCHSQGEAREGSNTLTGYYIYTPSMVRLLRQKILHPCLDYHPTPCSSNLYFV